jgi:FkbM family methyltransferase
MTTAVASSTSRNRLSRLRHRQSVRSQCTYSGCAWTLAFLLYTYAIGLFVRIATPPCFCELADSITTRIEYRDEIQCDPIRWALWGSKYANSQQTNKTTARSRGVKTDKKIQLTRTDNEFAAENPSVSKSLRNLTFYGRTAEAGIHPIDRVLYAKFFSGAIGSKGAVTMPGVQRLAQRKGVFVEVGAASATANSNSYFFEKELNWTGLLIEGSTPNIAHLIKQRSLRPNTRMIFKTVCEAPGTAKMVGEGFSAGLADEMTKEHKAIFSPNWSRTWASPYAVDCEPMQSVLSSHSVRNVDFMSIDVEGSELRVLRGFNFNETKVRVLVIDLRKEDGAKEIQSRALLKRQSFCLATRVGSTEFWTSDAAFQNAYCGWSEFVTEP